MKTKQKFNKINEEKRAALRPLHHHYILYVLLLIESIEIELYRADNPFVEFGIYTNL